MIIPANPNAQYQSYKKDIDSALRKVISSGRYILGEEVKEFEKEFADFNDTKFSIAVGSGTEALHICLTACGIGPNDEVITVAHTAVATASAISLSGATPRFVDIEDDSFSIDVSKIESLINKKTKAIIPVHIYGNPVDMKMIMKIARKHNLFVIEDCAQAHGAYYESKRVGSFGHMSCFSFYPTKNLGAIGDGGAIITNSKNFARECNLIREYGWKKRYISESKGWNSRLDEIQASILRVKLKNLDKDNNKRRSIAEIYNNDLNKISSDIITPSERDKCKHVYHLYVIKTSKRNKLKAYLEKHGIFTTIQYPVPIHLQPFYKNIKLHKRLKNTETVAKEILSLPIYPELEKSKVKEVIKCIKNFYTA